MAENGEIMGSVSQPAPVLILVHDDVEPPVQPIFDTPMRANDLVEAFGRQDGAEQIIGGLGCCLAGDFADALDLADSGQAGPLMVFDQPRDVSRDRGGAGFDAAMIGLDDRRGGDRFAGRAWSRSARSSASAKPPARRRPRPPTICSARH